MKLTGRRNGWPGAWLLAAALFAGTLTLVETKVPNETLYEAQAKLALAESGSDDGALRVVILGDSLARNAFGDGREAEEALANIGLEAEVVNLAVSAGTFPHFEPLIEEILATSPDVVILQMEALLEDDDTIDRSLTTRIRLWRQDQPARLPGPQCFGLRAGDTFEEFVGRARARFTEPRYHDSEAAGLAMELARTDSRVVLVGLPVSRQLEASEGALRSIFRAETIHRLATQTNVSVDDEYALPDAENFCDFSHLSDIGRQRFLEIWAARFHELVG